MTVSQAFLVSDDLDILRSTAQVYGRLSLSLRLVDWGSGFGRRNCRDEVPSQHCIKGYMITTRSSHVMLN